MPKRNCDGLAGFVWHADLSVASLQSVTQKRIAQGCVKRPQFTSSVIHIGFINLRVHKQIA